MPCHLIHGTDEYRIAKRVEELLGGAKLLTEMNLHRFDLELTPDAFLQAAECALTPPFMGGHRVVLVAGVGRLERRVKSAHDDEEKTESDPNAVEVASKLKGLPDYSLLILYDRLRKLDGRGKLYKTFSSFCKVEEFKPFFFDPLAADNRDLESWLRERAEAYELKLKPSGMRELIMRLGSDLRSVDMEMGKFRLAYGTGAEIGASQVAELTPPTITHSIFNLCDSLGQGKLKAALEFLHGMLAAKSPPPYVLTMLARHIRNIAIAKSLIDHGAEDSDIQNATGIKNRWVFDRFILQPRRFRGNYAKAHDILAECDGQLKSSGMDPKTALELCIIRLWAMAGAAR